MATPVNFDNLRSITGGDTDLELALFASFLDTGEACLGKLRAALRRHDEGAWRHEAHAFKGICMNLGAEPLSQLCNKAQADWRAPDDDKAEMLQAIESEYSVVRGILDSHA